MLPLPNVIVAFVALAVTPAGEERLPPRACVSELRSARIARARADPEGELAALRRGLAACPDQPAPIVALLSYGARHPLPAGEQEELRSALAGHLARPVDSLSLAALEAILREPALDPVLQDAIVAYLRRGLEVRKDSEALRLLARLQLHQEDLPAAAATLERLRAVDDSEDILWSLVGVYTELERWTELALLLSTLDAPSNDPALFLPLQVEASSRAGLGAETMAAIQRLSASLAGATDSAVELFADLVLQAAWNLRDQHADDEAEKLFRLVLAHDPEQGEARDALVHLYGNEEERRVHGDTLADRWSKETDPNLLLEEGSRRLATGDAEGAYDLLMRAAPHLAHLEAAWYNLGMAAVRLERWADAANALQRAAEVNPQRADSFFFRGHALVKQELWSDAIPALERSLELDPARALAHYDLALCFRETGQPDQAARHRAIYDQAVAPKP